jgi:predicted regulator of Ras-like GTPase activity (Roadblock/LC7/MglB family)
LVSDWELVSAVASKLLGKASRIVDNHAGREAG